MVSVSVFAKTPARKPAESGDASDALARLVGESNQHKVGEHGVINDGAGMYCYPTAEAEAKKLARKAGATRAALDNARTTSLDPTEGDSYETTIGSLKYHTKTHADDGDCFVDSIKLVH